MSKLDATHVDVVIIGGGCNGTGLARDLSKRGASVILCEKGDFARGATGASSGMIHGGPRYLLNDVKTTQHSCTDSGYIQKIVPHLLFRIPFLMPVPRDNPFGPAGMLLHDVYFDVYDRYVALKNGIPHARLSVEQMQALEPGLAGDFLGGITLDEWGIDAGRLCVLNACDAQAHGASIHTYTNVLDILYDANNNATGVRAQHADHAGHIDIACKMVVNCTGAWADMFGLSHKDTPMIRPGKGVHLIYEKRLTNFAIITNAIDGRQIFIMPYQNETWIGTTDDDYYGNLDDMSATTDEVAYLRQALERILPHLSAQRMIGTRVGVRNTMYGWGQQEDALSRGYKIVDHAPHRNGCLSLIGGKLASYRIQAEEAADVICARLGITARCRTHMDPLPGGDAMPSEEDLSRAYHIDRLAARRIIARHGSLASRVLDIGHETSTGFATVDIAEPTLECDIRYCIRHEHVTRLSDLMLRCRIAMGADMGLHAGLRAAQIFAQERGLDATDQRAALVDLLQHRWRSAKPVIAGAQRIQAQLLMQQYAPVAPALINEMMPYV